MPFEVAPPPGTTRTAATPETDPPRRSAWPSRLATALPAAFLALATLALFGPVVLVRNAHVPWDFVDQSYPFVAAVVRAWHEHHIPLWTPHLFAGFAIGGEPVAGSFYPPHVIVGLLHPSGNLSMYQLELLFVAHYWWAALGMYSLARRESGSVAGAMVAGVAYGFGGFMAGHAEHYPIVAVMAWAPWAALWSRRWMDEGRAGYGMLSAVAVAMIALAGAPQSATYAVLVLEAYILLSRRVSLRRLLGHWSFLALAALLSLPQIIATLQLTSTSVRTTFDYADTSASAIDGTTLVSGLVPHLWQVLNSDIPEQVLWIGAVPLLAALVAAVLHPRGNLFWIAVAAVTAVLALGTATPLHHLEYWLLPPARAFRRPGVWIGFTSFAIAILSARGVALVWQRTLARRLLAGALLLTTTLYGALWAYLHATAAAHAALAPVRDDAALLVGFGVLSVGALMVRRRAGAALLAGVACASVIAFMVGQVFDSQPGRPVGQLNPNGASGDQVVVPVVRELVAQRGGRVALLGVESTYDNGPLLFAVPDVWGYSQLRPATLQDAATRVSHVLDSPDARWLWLGLDTRSGLLRVLGVRFLVASGAWAQDHAADLAAARLVDPGSAGHPVYEIPGAAPAAFCPRGTVVTAADESTAVTRVVRDDFDPLRELVVSDEAGSTATGATCTAAVTQRSDDSLTVVVDAEGATTLVIDDRADPRWGATLDGRPVRVHTVDALLRGVHVAAGRHTVTMRFEDTPVRAAVWLDVALFTLIGAAALAWLGRAATPRWWRRSRRECRGTGSSGPR